MFAEEGGAEPAGEPTPNNMITFRYEKTLNDLGHVSLQDGGGAMGKKRVKTYFFLFS